VGLPWSKFSWDSELNEISVYGHKVIKIQAVKDFLSADIMVEDVPIGVRTGL